MKLGEHKTKIQRWQKRSAMGRGPIDMFTNERVSIELFYHTKNFSEAKKCFNISIECWRNNVEIPSLMMTLTDKSREDVSCVFWCFKSVCFDGGHRRFEGHNITNKSVLDEKKTRRKKCIIKLVLKDEKHVINGCLTSIYLWITIWSRAFDLRFKKLIKSSRYDKTVNITT